MASSLRATAAAGMNTTLTMDAAASLALAKILEEHEERLKTEIAEVLNSPLVRPDRPK